MTDACLNKEPPIKMKGFFCCLNYAFGVLLGVKYRFMIFMITIIIVKFICIALFRTSVKREKTKKGYKSSFQKNIKNVNYR